MTTTMMMMKAIIILIIVFTITPNHNNNIVDCTDEHVVVSSYTTQQSSIDVNEASNKRLLFEDNPIIGSAESFIHKSSSLPIFDMKHYDEQVNKPSIVKGYTTVSRSKFMKQFDIGIPQTWSEYENIILLYTDHDSMISNATYEEKIDKCDTVKVIMTLTPKKYYNIKECIAIVDNGNIEASAIDTWQRTFGRRRLTNRRTNSRRTRRSNNDARDNDNNVNLKNIKSTNNNNIRKVQNEKIIKNEENINNHNHNNNNNRLLSSTTESWHHVYKPYHWVRGEGRSTDDTFPTELTQDISNKELMNYFTYYPDALIELENITNIAGHDPITNERRPIIVMVMNLGHMHYFFNYMCTATARNINDLSNIIIFTTDKTTYDIVTDTYKNIENAPHAYYNEHIFADIPTSEPSNYAEKAYGRIFMTKVYCVHLINMLKYDVIFSDVDLVLYRNPTEYFYNKVNKRNNDNNNDDRNNDDVFDIYISDNGSDNEGRFGPYHGNTGFYYVAYNTKTQYFLYCLLKSGDLILLENSHQSVFLMIAYQHSTIRGLRLKNLYNKESYAKYLSNNNNNNNGVIIDPYDNELVLSGNEYEFQKELIEKMMNGEVVPFIFHANRFENHEKVDKLIETKNWHMKYDQCATSDLVVQTYNNLNTDNNLLNECCLLQPYIKV